MILFYIYLGNWVKTTGTQGRIVYTKVTILPGKRYIFWGINQPQFPNRETSNGAFMNLETGEILCRGGSYWKFPEWTKDPLLRALKIEEFKQQQRKDKSNA